MPVREETLKALTAHAAAADSEPVWPAASWEALRQGGVLGWAVPKVLGGSGREGAELLDGYERLAGACLTACFLLSQREAAVRRLAASDNEALSRELLPSLARGETFATVGLSQLTTSRQHGKPAMTAKVEGEALILDGFMPWVTGAARADHFITGAVLDDGRQILAALPGGLPGITVGPPLDLMALRGSLTAEVRCEQVRLERRWLLAGPAERVLAGDGRGGTGGLETSCLALGLAGAAIAYLLSEAAVRPDLAAPVHRLHQVHEQVRAEMHRLAQGGSTAAAAAALRARANALVLRATQTALAASKGAGFLLNHPAQRWARQALFFLVWSCPRPAVEGTLAYLTPPGESECP